MADSNWRRKIAAPVIAPVARMLAHTPLTPDFITVLGFLMTCGAAALVALHNPLWGGIGVLVAGVMDAFDGALARQTGRVSRFGAVLDSTLDRFSEGAVLLGIIYVLAKDGSELGAVLAGATLMLSFCVSYIRSRAEGMGIECTEGWFTRVERVVVIALGLIVDKIIIAMCIVAVLSLVTVIQRLVITSSRLRAAK